MSGGRLADKRHRRHDKRQEMQSVRCRFKLRPLASAQAVGNSTRGGLMNGKGSSTLRECGHRYDSVVPAPEGLLEKLRGPHDDLVARGVLMRQFSRVGRGPAA